MKYIFLLFSVLVFFGCSRVVTPAVTQYRVLTNISDKTQDMVGCKKSIKIAQAFSSSSLMSQHMNYTQGSTKLYAYSQAQWAESPNLAITNEFFKHIQKADIFQTVLSSKSRSKADMLLEINIEDFMQYFNEDETKSYVHIALSLTLLDTKTSKPIATKSFEVREDVKTLDASGGVDALNHALEVIINKSIKYLEGKCR